MGGTAARPCLPLCLHIFSAGLRCDTVAAKQMNMAALVSLDSPRSNASLRFDRAALRWFPSHVRRTRHPKLAE